MNPRTMSPVKRTGRIPGRRKRSTKRTTISAQRPIAMIRNMISAVRSSSGFFSSSFIPFSPLRPSAGLPACPLYSSPSVATITALMVCMRFSASSNTTLCCDSKTSSVTSFPLTAGRQCMKMVLSFPVFFISSALT